LLQDWTLLLDAALEKGGRECLQPAGQPPIGMAPKSKTEFFATAVNAEITLQIGDNGAVTGFTLVVLMVLLLPETRGKRLVVYE